MAALLSGCVVPASMSGMGAERHSSMLASNASCPGNAQLGSSFDRRVDPARPDQQLLSEGLRVLVNQERCRRGAVPLGLSAAAVDASAGHAVSMARHDFMGHNSPVNGRETLPRRLHAENARFGWAAENVARAPTTALSPTTGACLNGPGGLGPTYRELANGLFGMWINSAGHRRNILDPNFRAVGAGIGVNPAKHRCGEIAAAMVFIG